MSEQQHTAVQRKPTAQDVTQAWSRIAPHVRPATLLTSPALDARVGARVLVVPECLQFTGSFKLRGALNRILRLPDTVRTVVAYSSGNHAQGVARAARLRGLRAVIYMPHDAPASKLDRVRADGAEIVYFDRARDRPDELARARALQEDGAFVHPFDDSDVLAGNGTVGLNLMTQVASLGAALDTVIIPCSGGGLLTGSALAIHAYRPEAAIYAAEPSGWDDYTQSLQQGERIRLTQAMPTVCDALRSYIPGELTFPIAREHVRGGVAVSDAQVLAAMRFAALELKLIVEPGGAVALAALLAECVPVRGQTVVIVLSGGNVDAAMIERALQSES
jgi:threonine dehydratase